MLKFCIGIAVAWLIATVFRIPVRISGLIGFILAGFIFYGIGSLILLVLTK